jgi:hypothetical protein
MDGKEVAVPVSIIRNVLRTSGMSRERYFELRFFG